MKMRGHAYYVEFAGRSGSRWPWAIGVVVAAFAVAEAASRVWP